MLVILRKMYTPPSAENGSMTLRTTIRATGTSKKYPLILHRRSKLTYEVRAPIVVGLSWDDLKKACLA